MKAFWTKYHVFIIGLISSVCLTLSEFTTGKEIDWMVVGYAVFVGVGSYFAKNLKGQGATIAGILLTTGANTYTVLHDGGQVNVSQLLMTVAVSVGLALAHASSTPATTVDVKPVELYSNTYSLIFYKKIGIIVVWLLLPIFLFI
jgi:hypothetical protein